MWSLWTISSNNKREIYAFIFNHEHSFRPASFFPHVCGSLGGFRIVPQCNRHCTKQLHNWNDPAEELAVCVKCRNVAACEEFLWPKQSSLVCFCGVKLTSLLLLVVGQFLDRAALAEAPHRTGQPFSQSVSRAFGTRRAGMQGAEGGLRLQVRHRFRLPVRAADRIVF